MSLSQAGDTRSEKRELRRVLRARRKSLPHWKQQGAAQRMARLIRRQRWYRRARTLAVYLAGDGEINPDPLIKAACTEGKCLLLPRLRQKRLEFVRYRPGNPLRRNRFNIPEPIGSAVPLRKIDVICMPLVGFDRQGGRLGMGGGFYDRTLAVLQGAGRLPGPRLIGLAYACQEVAQLPHEEWDVQLAGIVTECEWIRVRRIIKKRFG